MALLNTEVIDKLNAQIRGIILSADNMCEVINQKIENNPAQAQEIVNEKMNDLENSLTDKGNDVRNNIIDTFSAQYQTALEKIEPILALIDLAQNLSIDTVVDVVKSIINILIAPYQPIVEFTTEVLPKIKELSNNLTELINYKPPIKVPEGVNIPPLNVNIEPITPGDITGGSESNTPPEEE